MKQTFTIALLFFLSSFEVFAQATRTWISGLGDDVNPCSRTAPCKTFAGAISKTAIGGEINTLDASGYGAITITKSITINGEGTNSSILSTGVNAIVINASNTSRVILKNININGSGTGLNGIRFIGGQELHIENVTINGLAAGAAGLTIALSNDCVVNMDNVKIFPGDKSNPETAGIRATTTAGKIQIHAKNTVIEGATLGVNLIDNITFSADNTVIQNNTTGLLSQGNSKAILHNSELLFNTTGLSALGTNTEISIKGSNVSFNTSLGSGTGKIYSYGGNMTYGNTNDFPMIVRSVR